MVLPRAVAKINRKVTNRVTGPVAGRLPGQGIVHHIGRKSGRPYSTPVSVFRRYGAYRIALTYGPDADWLKNILAAGEFTLETRGEKITLTTPTVHQDPTVAWAPPGVRHILKGLSADHYVEARPASS